jgi:hypothetical protein
LAFSSSVEEHSPELLVQLPMRLEAGVMASGHHLLFFAQMHLDVLGQHGQRLQHPDLVAIAS